MVEQNKALQKIDQKLVQVDIKVSQIDQGILNFQNLISNLRLKIHKTHE